MLLDYLMLREMALEALTIDNYNGHYLFNGIQKEFTSFVI